jgi:ABC-type oligopeptide transport system substrate-binding subunit
MKMKKLIAFLILVMISLAGSVNAGSVYLTLSTSQTSSSTASYEGLRAQAYNAHNSTTSARSVYCYLKRYDYYGGVANAATNLLDPGETYSSGWKNAVLPGSNLWAVELNPYGWATSGCDAYATLQYSN